MPNFPKPEKAMALQLEVEHRKINTIVNQLMSDKSVHLDQAKSLQDSMFAVSDAIIRDRINHEKTFEEFGSIYNAEVVAPAEASLVVLMRRRDRQLLECMQYANSVLCYMANLEKKNKNAYRGGLLSKTHGYQILASLINLNHYAAAVIDDPSVYSVTIHASILENCSRIIKSATQAAIGREIPFGQFKRYQALYFSTCDRITESTALKYLVSAVFIMLPPVYIAVMIFTAICILADMPRFLKHDRTLADSYVIAKKSPVGKGINLTIFQPQSSPLDAFHKINNVKAGIDKQQNRKRW